MIGYFPNEYVDDVNAINYEALYRKGFRGLIFDIDNTLVAHGTDCTPEVEELFQRLHDIGFRTLLLSNNSPERVERFAKNIETLQIADAGKPRAEAFHRAVEMLETAPESTVVIGDTTHTDILGANRAGLKSILVKYIGYNNRERKGIRRNIERVMLMFFPLVAKRKRIL